MHGGVPDAQSLCNFGSDRASTAEHDTHLGAIAHAELAAAGGQGSEALEWLSKTGMWVLDGASKVGVGVATAALKVALGL